MELHTNMKTSSQSGGRVDGASWLGALLLPGLESFGGKLIPKFICVSYSKMSGWLFTSWTSVQAGGCSRTMPLNVEVNLPQKTLTQLRCCGLTSREQFVPDIGRICPIWSSSVGKNGPTILLNTEQVWSASYKMPLWGYYCKKGYYISIVI